MRARRVIVPLGGAVLGLHCASLGGLESGDGADAAGADALAEAQETGPPPPADEGGADADAAAPFCASLAPAPTFCDDFDEGAPLVAGWDQLSVYNGAAGLLDTLARSPPFAFLASLPATDGDAAFETGAALVKTFPAKVPNVRLAYDVRVDAAVGDGWIWPSQIEFGTTDGFDSVQLAVSRNSGTLKETRFGDAGSDVSHDIARGVPLGVWVRVEIALAFTVDANGTATSSVATVSFDGVDAAGPIPIGAHVVWSAPTVKVGMTYAQNPAVSWAARFDDVVVDLK